jgi:hypothetical protein
MLLFSILLGVYTGAFYSFRFSAWLWRLHHLWVGLASLWLLWPLVLALHPGRSALRLALPLGISVAFLIPCTRAYRAMAPVTFDLPIIHYVVSYYDRNGDGIVDFELHHALNADDADWALSDTRFRGRYDFRQSSVLLVENSASTRLCLAMSRLPLDNRKMEDEEMKQKGSPVNRTGNRASPHY